MILARSAYVDRTLVGRLSKSASLSRTNQKDAVVRSLAADKGYFPSRQSPRSRVRHSHGNGDAHCSRRRKQGLGTPLRQSPLIAPPVPSRASLARRFCASAAYIWNAASSTPLTKAECARPRSGEACFNLSLLLRALLGVGTANNGSQARPWLASGCYRLPLRASFAFVTLSPGPAISSFSFPILSESRPLPEITGFQQFAPVRRSYRDMN